RSGVVVGATVLGRPFRQAGRSPVPSGRSVARSVRQVGRPFRQAGRSPVPSGRLVARSARRVGRPFRLVYSRDIWITIKNFNPPKKFLLIFFIVLQNYYL
ncbi:MAG: hypothetical protein FWG68_08320, partial [Defluviitaleaceae bacterium]|nr:hypothetical protein [Defluviitaleaceae bacterium]